jgi:Tfp pilus assembly protein PilF
MDASMTHASARKARQAASLAALLIFTVGVSGCNKLKARDLLNKGVNAFKAGQSDTAIEDFKKAKELDPSLMMAQVYLATAYASLYIPGLRRRTRLEASRLLTNSRPFCKLIPTI